MKNTSIVLALMIIAVPPAAQAQRITAQVATIIASYAAEYTCACVYVSHRKLSACVADLDPRAKPFIALRVDASTKSVMTNTLHVATARAGYAQRYGCGLVSASQSRRGRHAAARSRVSKPTKRRQRIAVAAVA